MIRRSVLIGMLLLIPSLLWAGGWSISDETAVYLGDTDSFEVPAEVQSATVFEEIPEWQEIQERGLKKGDPEFYGLWRRASGKFNFAVAAVAENSGYDLMIEAGAISSDTDVAPDVTQAVIEALP